MSQPKYAQVAERIRAQIADGMLKPGEPVPSGAALARATGYNVLTCRKALRILIKEGVLVPGASPGARPRVPLRRCTRGELTLAGAARALSAGLAAHRRARGLTQPQLATMTGMSLPASATPRPASVAVSRLRDRRLCSCGVGNHHLGGRHDVHRQPAVGSRTASS